MMATPNPANFRRYRTLAIDRIGKIVERIERFEGTAYIGRDAPDRLRAEISAAKKHLEEAGRIAAGESAP